MAGGIDWSQLLIDDDSEVEELFSGSNGGGKRVDSKDERPEEANGFRLKNDLASYVSKSWLYLVKSSCKSPVAVYVATFLWSSLDRQNRERQKRGKPPSLAVQIGTKVRDYRRTDWLLTDKEYDAAIAILKRGGFVKSHTQLQRNFWVVELDLKTEEREALRKERQEYWSRRVLDQQLAEGRRRKTRKG